MHFKQASIRSPHVAVYLSLLGIVTWTINLSILEGISSKSTDSNSELNLMCYR